MKPPAFAACVSLALAACVGTTGNTIVHFRAEVAGPADAPGGGAALDFTSGLGWHVVLTRATIHVGAMYLVQTQAASGGGVGPCVLTGTYVAEATTPAGAVAGIDADLLSPAPQYFPKAGQGTNLAAEAGQVWLTGAEVDQVDDPTIVLDVEGVADKGGVTVPFVVDGGGLTIGQNRVVTPTDSTKPGSQPICRQRIVSPIPLDIVPTDGGTLLLRVDPRLLFVDIDFSMLMQVSSSPPQYAFVDDSSDSESAVLYSLLHQSSVYEFAWLP